MSIPRSSSSSPRSTFCGRPSARTARTIAAPRRTPGVSRSRARQPRGAGSERSQGGQRHPRDAGVGPIVIRWTTSRTTTAPRRTHLYIQSASRHASRGSRREREADRDREERRERDEDAAHGVRPDARRGSHRRRRRGRLRSRSSRDVRDRRHRGPPAVDRRVGPRGRRVGPRDGRRRRRRRLAERARCARAWSRGRSARRRRARACTRPRSASRWRTSRVALAEERRDLRVREEPGARPTGASTSSVVDSGPSNPKRAPRYERTASFTRSNTPACRRVEEAGVAHLIETLERDFPRWTRRRRRRNRLRSFEPRAREERGAAPTASPMSRTRARAGGSSSSRCARGRLRHRLGIGRVRDRILDQDRMHMRAHRRDLAVRARDRDRQRKDEPLSPRLGRQEHERQLEGVVVARSDRLSSAFCPEGHPGRAAVLIESRTPLREAPSPHRSPLGARSRGEEPTRRARARS